MIVTSPKDLTYTDLKQIQLILKDEEFDESRLNLAWKNKNKEFLTADIISFIRQAALGENLQNHDEKISQAMKKVYGMSDWNNRQMDVLKKIESQLLATPVLAPTAREYFDKTEIWRQNGGYDSVASIFGEDIEIIISIINDNLYIGGKNE